MPRGWDAGTHGRMGAGSQGEEVGEGGKERRRRIGPDITGDSDSSRL